MRREAGAACALESILHGASYVSLFPGPVRSPYRASHLDGLEPHQQDAVCLAADVRSAEAYLDPDDRDGAKAARSLYDVFRYFYENGPPGSR